MPSTNGKEVYKHPQPGFGSWTDKGLITRCKRQNMESKRRNNYMTSCILSQNAKARGGIHRDSENTFTKSTFDSKNRSPSEF